MVYQLSITSIAGSQSFTITFYNRTEKLYLHFSAVRSRTNKELVAIGYEDGIINRSWWRLLLIREIINPISQSDQLKHKECSIQTKSSDIFPFVYFSFSFTVVGIWVIMLFNFFFGQSAQIIITFIIPIKHNILVEHIMKDFHQRFPEIFKCFKFHKSFEKSLIVSKFISI